MKFKKLPEMLTLVDANGLEIEAKYASRSSVVASSDVVYQKSTINYLRK